MGKPLGISQLEASEQEVVGSYSLSMVEAFQGRHARGWSRWRNCCSDLRPRTWSRMAFGGNHGLRKEGTWRYKFLEIL